MATIRKRGERFHVQVRRKGFSTITKTFELLADAREWARLQDRKADRGELGPDRKELESITLADLVTRYRDTILSEKKGGSVETIMLTAFLRHSICKKRLSDLTATDFTKWKDEKMRPKGDRKGITAKSVKRLLSPVQHMFELAMTDWEIPLRENPLSRFKLKVIDNKRQRRLREGELDRLLEAGRKTQNPLVMLIVLFALETAMRRGEILALRFRDIDMGRRSVMVRESKNGHSRTIPLSSTAATILIEALDRMGDDDKRENAKVFPMAPNALLLSWNRLTKRAKLDDLNFHDLRHEAISRLFELGLTVPEVASISGHRDPRMLFRYAHATQTAIRAKLSPAEPEKPAPSPSSPKWAMLANDNQPRRDSAMVE